MKHVEAALFYCEEVISGDVLACEFVKSACRRHLRDLKRQNTKSFPYWFDAEAAEKAIVAAEVRGNVMKADARRAAGRFRQRH